MNSNRLNQILSSAKELDAAQLKELEDSLREYPYFQAIRAVQLKGYYENHNFSYHSALKKTAAYTTNRGVLFDYITASQFDQHKVAVQIKNRHQKDLDTEQDDFDQAVQMDSKEADQVLDPNLFKARNENSVEAETAPVEKEAPTPTAPSKTESFEKPAQGEETEENKSESQKHFRKDERRSFEDWLKLTSTQPIDRGQKQPEEKKDAEDLSEVKMDPKKSLQREIINRFIEHNPKIEPSKKTGGTIFMREYEPENALMTETLAKIYAEQKQYQKAIQAYKILILKNPEKSGFFADRIRKIENHIENKNQ